MEANILQILAALNLIAFSINTVIRLYRKDYDSFWAWVCAIIWVLMWFFKN